MKDFSNFWEKFKKVIHFGVLTTSTTENVLCPECSGGSVGMCKNAATQACTDQTAIGRCPRRFQPCSETVVRLKDTFMISAEFNDTNFTNPENILRYTTQIKVKRNAGSENANEPLFDFFTEGLFDVATNSVVVSVDGSKRIVDIQVIMNKVNEDTYEVMFEFPSVLAGEKIYYN